MRLYAMQYQRGDSSCRLSHSRLILLGYYTLVRKSCLKSKYVTFCTFGAKLPRGLACLGKVGSMAKSPFIAFGLCFLNRGERRKESQVFS